jgi:hypothetical protein
MLNVSLSPKHKTHAYLDDGVASVLRVLSAFVVPSTAPNDVVT